MQDGTKSLRSWHKRDRARRGDEGEWKADCPAADEVAAAAAKPAAAAIAKVKATDVSVYYGEKQALFDVSLDMPEKSVTALVTASGAASPPSCARSTG